MNNMKDPETKEELCKRCKIGYVGITVLNNDGLCFPCETELRKIKFDSAPPETSSWEEEFRKLPHYKIFLEDQIAFIRNLASSEYKRGQQEERQFILNILDGIDIADKEMGNKGGGTKAIRHALQSRII